MYYIVKYITTVIRNDPDHDMDHIHDIAQPLVSPWGQHSMSKFFPKSLGPNRSTGGEEGRGKDVVEEMRDESCTHTLSPSALTTGPQHIPKVYLYSIPLLTMTPIAGLFPPQHQ